MAIIAPYARFSVRDQFGLAAVDGFVETYQNQTNIPKITYQDPAGTIPNSNPVQLDGKGEANIYWDIEETLYTIIIYDKNGVEILTQSNYPFTGTGSTSPDITIDETPLNLVRNAQFFSWNQDPANLISTQNVIYDRLGLGEPICNEWFFERSNTNATITIERAATGGDVGVPSLTGNPPFCLRYTCSNVGAGGWGANIYQIYPSARTLSGQNVSFGMRVINNSATDINFQAVFVQYFGTGGTPSTTVYTNIANQSIGPLSGWTSVLGNISLPSVNGKTFGTNGDDSSRLQIIFPSNTLADLYYTNVQLHVGSILPNFPITTNSDQLRGLNDIVVDSVFRVGDVKYSLRPSDPGWVLVTQNATIGNYLSGSTHIGNGYLNLFVFIWDYISNTYCPIYNSNGSIGTRGSSAIADWKANKRLSLPNLPGRVIGGSGAATGIGNYVEGEYIGAIATQPTDSNMHTHHHAITDIQWGTVPEPGGGAYELIGAADFKPITLNTEDSGQNNTLSIMQPTIFFNPFIKL